MVSLHEEDEQKIKERQGAEGTYSSEPQRYMPLVSLILWRKMVAVRCLFGLQSGDRGQTIGWQADEKQISVFF